VRIIPYELILIFFMNLQYELSFKVWQCHGRLVDAPCSRVGHIYRCKYVPFPNPGVGDFISRNYKRVALVWMDEYAEHLYKRNPSIRAMEPGEHVDRSQWHIGLFAGDLTKQLEVRTRLKCKSFDWFMKEVAFDQDKFYPAIEPPNGAMGRIENVEYPGLCVNARTSGKDEVVRFSHQGGLFRTLNL
jgi:polypeptide N-acetylgalactosaminyltransferase